MVPLPYGIGIELIESIIERTDKKRVISESLQ